MQKIHRNIIQRNRKKCCRKTNQLQSVQGYGNKETIKIFVSLKIRKKSVAMASLVARCCRKANQLQSVQGYGKQRTHKIVKETEKSVTMAKITIKILFCLDTYTCLNENSPLSL